MRDIVYLTPDLSLTGAPKLLAAIAADTGGVVVARHGGALRDVVERAPGLRAIVPAAPGKLAIAEINARLAAATRGARVLPYVNTVAALWLLRRTFLAREPFVLHAHEMTLSLAANASAADLALARRARAVVAVSPPVAAALRAAGIDAERITVIPGFVDDALLARPRPERGGSGDGAAPLVVGGIGIPTQLKGCETWLHAARLLRATRPRAVFRWLGVADDVHARAFRRMVELAGLGDAVELLPPGDATAFFDGIDVLWHCSWEDSMPLAVLEAMALGVPALVVRGAGGAADAVAEDALVLPHNDPALFAARTEALFAPRGPGGASGHARAPAELVARLRDRARAFARSAVLPRYRAWLDAHR